MSAVALRAPRTTEHWCLWRRPVLPTGTGGTLGKTGLKKWESRLPSSKPAPEAGTRAAQEDRHSSLHTGSLAASLEEAVFPSAMGYLQGVICWLLLSRAPRAAVPPLSRRE